MKRLVNGILVDVMPHMPRRAGMAAPPVIQAAKSEDQAAWEAHLAELAQHVQAPVWVPLHAPAQHPGLSPRAAAFASERGVGDYKPAYPDAPIFANPASLSGLGDMNASNLSSLLADMNAWNQAIQGGDGPTAANALNDAANIAANAAADPTLNGPTASALSFIAGNAGILAGPVSSMTDVSQLQAPLPGGGSQVASTYAQLLDVINANVNSVVTSSGSAGVATTYQASPNSALVSQIAGQQQGLKQAIGQLQPNGVWSITDALGAVSADQVTPLQNEWQQINSQIQTAYASGQISASDYQALDATQQQILQVLGSANAAANNAGSSAANALSKACATLRAMGLPCAPQSGQDTAAKPWWPPSTGTLIALAIGAVVVIGGVVYVTSRGARPNPGRYARALGIARNVGTGVQVASAANSVRKRWVSHRRNRRAA